MNPVPIFGLRGYGKLTQLANTVITRLVEPVRGAFTRLVYAEYTAGVTAHTLTVMRPLNVVYFTAVGAAGQAVVNISADPGAYPANCQLAANNIAANDFVVYEAANGTYVLDTVSSVSTLAITLNNNLPTGGVALGGKFWWFGIITDTNPADNNPHPQYTLAASGLTSLGGKAGHSIGGFVGTIPNPNTNFGAGNDGRYQPIIVHSGNATNAGVLEQVTAIYTGR